jgi:hypothetical protein
MEEIQNGNSTLETGWQFVTKVNIHLAMGPSHLVPCMYPNELKFMFTQKPDAKRDSCFIHNILPLETIKRILNKGTISDLVHPCSRVLFSNKKPLLLIHTKLE